MKDDKENLLTSDIDNNLYVFEKSIKIQEKNLEIIGNSISAERAKAGLLLGFFFLASLQSLSEFRMLDPVCQGIVITLFLFVFYFY